MPKIGQQLVAQFAQSIWLWRCRGLSRCIIMVEGHFFFFAIYGRFFLQIRGPINRCTMLLLLFSPSPNSQRGSHLARPKKNIVVVTFPTEDTVFTFFGARSPSKTHCFDFSFVSSVYQWFHVSSTVSKRRRSSSEFRLNSARRVFEVILRWRLFFSVRYSSRGQLFHAQNLVQDMATAFSWDACHLSQLANFHPTHTRSWILSTAFSVVAVFGPSDAVHQKTNVGFLPSFATQQQE